MTLMEQGIMLCTRKSCSEIFDSQSVQAQVLHAAGQPPKTLQQIGVTLTSPPLNPERVKSQSPDLNLIEMMIFQLFPFLCGFRQVCILFPS